MITLFRRIRKKLIESGSIPKYLLYAIGEILLVVIGILIALQVNNWNEERKNKQAILTIFSDIQEDLLNDIQEFDLALEWYQNLDSITDHIISGKLTKEDFLNNKDRELFQPGLGYYGILQSDQSYQLLLNSKDKIPLEYKEIMKSLSSLYEEDQYFLNSLQQMLKDVSVIYRDQITEEHEWSIAYSNDMITEEMADYFANSTYHKQKVSNWRNRLQLLLNIINRVKAKSLTNYMIMRHLTMDDSELPALIQNFGLSGEPPIGDYKAKLYSKSKDGSLVEGQLDQRYGLIFWKYLDEKRAFYIDNMMLAEIKKDSLVLVEFGKYTLSISRDSSGNITGMTSYDSNGQVDTKFSTNLPYQ
jgi:hypothetical protein